MTLKDKCYYWFIAFRPKTLSAGFICVLLGGAFGYYTSGTLSWTLTLSCLFSVIFIQIAANLINDAIDGRKGRDTEKRKGFLRVTQQGIFSYKTVMIGAFVFILLSLLSALPVFYEEGWPFILLGVICVFFAYAYSGGPFPLAQKGLGDLFVILFFGITPVVSVFYLNTGFINLESFILGLQVGFLNNVLLLINNMRDLEEDKNSEKKTLIVRKGLSFGRGFIFLIYFINFSALGYWSFSERSIHFLLPIIFIPLAFFIIKGVQKEPSEKYNDLLYKSSLLNLGYCFLLSAIFALL